MAEYISKQKVTDRLGCCLANAKAEYKAAKDEFTKARFGDYISAIQAMIDVVECTKAADVQPVDRWISVEDRLPEKDGYYLVVTQGIHNPTIDIAGFWHYAEWVQKEIRENYWNKYDKVLYWQPLPNLPEAIKG